MQYAGPQNAPTTNNLHAQGHMIKIGISHNLKIAS